MPGCTSVPKWHLGYPRPLTRPFGVYSFLHDNFMLLVAIVYSSKPIGFSKHVFSRFYISLRKLIRIEIRVRVVERLFRARPHFHTGSSCRQATFLAETAVYKTLKIVISSSSWFTWNTVKQYARYQLDQYKRHHHNTGFFSCSGRQTKDEAGTCSNYLFLVMIHWWVRKPSRGPNNYMSWAMTEAEGEVGIP